ncbi:MAG: hypothetical protein R3182_11170 [Draconibacterium sp.]|nr:hypothetical protein [Draconibacterium sp.]
MNQVIALIFSICISVCVYAQPNSTTVLTDWNDTSLGVNGWSRYNTPPGASDIEYMETGGNAGGYLRLQGFAGSGFKNMQANYTGNYVQKGINHISVDVMFPQQLPTEYDGYKANVVISTAATQGRWNYQFKDVLGSNSGVWQHLEVFFDPEWTDEDARDNGWSPGYNTSHHNYRTFRETMENVGIIAFKRIYAPYQIHYFAIDNFQIEHVDVIPSDEETTEADNANFSFHLSDWEDASAEVGEWTSSFNNRTFTYHSSGGNPGGHIRVYGHPAIGTENSEPGFTGNYIQKGCNLITLDLMIPQALPVIVEHNKGTVIIKSDALNYEWRYYLGELSVTQPGVWQHIEIPFNTAWNDTEAEANGWHSGRTTQTSNNLTFHEMMQQVTGVAIHRSYDNALHYLAIDNFKLSKEQSTEEVQPLIKPLNKTIKAAPLPANRRVKKPIKKSPVGPVRKSRK